MMKIREAKLMLKSKLDNIFTIIYWNTIRLLDPKKNIEDK